jgi:hypothetical protein
MTGATKTFIDIDCFFDQSKIAAIAVLFRSSIQKFYSEALLRPVQQLETAIME